jgi:hypothetical protein
MIVVNSGYGWYGGQAGNVPRDVSVAKHCSDMASGDPAHAPLGGDQSACLSFSKLDGSTRRDADRNDLESLCLQSLS